MNFIIKRLFWGCCACALSGCAVTNQVSNKPIKTNKASTEVFLTLNNIQWEDTWRIKYVDGRKGVVPVKVKVKNHNYPNYITTVNVLNGTGVMIGKRIMTVYSGNIVIDELERRMNELGYKVKSVRKLPRYVINGIDISVLTSEIDKHQETLGYNARCNLKLKLDIIKNGVVANSYKYESALSDDWIMDTDSKYLNLLTKSANNIVDQAIPSILKEL